MNDPFDLKNILWFTERYFSINKLLLNKARVVMVSASDNKAISYNQLNTLVEGKFS